MKRQPHQTSNASNAPLNAHPEGVSHPHANARAGARTLLMVSLSRFYALPANMAKALPYVTGSSPISLRLIDWFVTNYAKTRNIVLARAEPAGGGGGVGHFNVYLSYRAQLKAYSKQQFDPFRRRDRISFFYQPDRSFETTIGQLNFFRWMLQNQVLEYVTEHAAEIEKDMLASSPTAGSGVGETNEGGKEEEQDQEEQGHQEEHHSTHSTPSKVHAPPPTRAHVSSLHGGRRRAPQAQCRVTQSMTRVGGQHTVAFE